MKVLLVGDVHTGSRALTKEKEHQLANLILHCKHDKIIIGGDFVDLLKHNDLIWHIDRHPDLFKALFARKDKIIYVVGNHDEPLKYFEHFGGIKIVPYISFKSGHKQVLITHGHEVDRYCIEHPDLVKWLVRTEEWLEDRALNARNWFRMKFDKTIITRLEYQKELLLRKYINYDMIISGHTHLPTVETIENVVYGNWGCWTKDSSYLELENGNLTLIKVK